MSGDREQHHGDAPGAERRELADSQKRATLARDGLLPALLRGHRALRVEPRDRGVEVMVELVELRTELGLRVQAGVEALGQVSWQVGAVVAKRWQVITDLAGGLRRRVARDRIRARPALV